MIEHKYLKLFYRFCKENCIVEFIPRTFDNDLKSIKAGAPLYIINNDLYKEIILRNNKHSYGNMPFILCEMQSYDIDIYFDNYNKETYKKRTFFPESLICLLRTESIYTKDKLYNFSDIYNKWCLLIKNEVVDDFIYFINTKSTPKELTPYKFHILNYVETYKPKSKNMILAALNDLKPSIKKEYPDHFDSFYIYECFASLHKAWKNYLLNKL